MNWLNLQTLAGDNFSINCEGEEDEDTVEAENDALKFESSPANPFNKSIQVLVDEALRWHDRLLRRRFGGMTDEVVD